MPQPAAWSLMLEGAKLDLLDTLLRVGVLAVACLAFALGQRFLSRQHIFRSLGLQLNLFVLVLLVLLVLRPVLDQMNGYVRGALQATAVLLGVTMGLKLLDILLFDRLPRWRNKPQVPLVLRDIGRWALAVVALMLIVRGFFPGVNLNVLAVSSLVVGYIVGNATQDTLGNLFAGLALNAERPFQIGDWVTAGGHTGVVVDTTWRATRLRTKADDYIVIPNSSIGKESIVNFSHPTRNHGCYLTIGVSYDTPPTKARETILAVLGESPEVCQQPPPSVFLVNYGNFSIDFKIKFFIEDFARIDPIQSTVMDRLWYAFRREGVSIPYPVQEEHFHDAAAEAQARRGAEAAAVRELLSRVDLFQSLSPEEINRLASGVKLKLFARGENLCREGEAGDSFYVIREGRVGIFVNDSAGHPVRAAQLEAGAFFGEMSLLTGAPRSATVTAETDVEVLYVSKQDFAGLLQANTHLAGKLAAALEQRLAELRAIRKAPAGAAPGSETRSALTARILKFFRLG
jgi:small-conductance mechanosensitive channel/CRP-like cAMP-binding protein